MPIIIEEDGTKTEQFQNEGERALFYMTVGKSFDNEKQLERYTKKCETLVFDFVKRSNPDIFLLPGMRRKNHTAILSLDAFLQSLFKLYLAVYSQDENGVDRNEQYAAFRDNNSIIDWLMPNYYFRRNMNILGQRSAIIIENIVYEMHESYQEDPNCMKFSRLSHVAFKSACQDYVAKVSYEQGKVEQSAKYTCLPKTDSDFIELLRHTIAIIFADLALLTNQSTGDNISETMQRIAEKIATEEFKSMGQSLAEATKECEALKESLSNAEMKNRHLSEQLAASRGSINSIAEDNAEYVNALLRKIAKLEKRIDELTPEVTVETANDVVEHSQINTHEVDMNLNYLFVFGDEAPGQQQIIDAFPNAMIYNNQNINNAKIDMVVFMTAFLPHSRCNTVKNYCQRKDIPFIYCGVSNVECVKEIIWNAIND